jgi:uncharacterized protein (TIGR02453 family)
MSDGFAELIDVSNRFFSDLKANNNREWFQDRKNVYATEIKKPAELVADLLAEDLNRMTGVSHKPKLFRIHRDVRFSKDKTPYNPHLHFQWSRPDSQTAPNWFLGSSPEYLIVAMGVMAPGGEALSRYRSFVDVRGDEIAVALERVSSGRLSDWGAAPLKRVPKPFDSEHPHGDLLKRKTLIVEASFPDDWQQAGLLESARRLFAAMMPLWRILDDGMA